MVQEGHTMAQDLIPADWRTAIGADMDVAAFTRTMSLVAQARHAHPGEIYPPEAQVFAALEMTRVASVRAVIVGQDPYPGPGQAHGLAFSFLGDPNHLPGSLKNIRKELLTDLHIQAPPSGSLEPWARHGVLLLNTILTVQRGKPGSHRSLGWQAFTDAVLRAVARSTEPVVFLLWGRVAQAKSNLVISPHVEIDASHPSPQSARGFLGQHPFSRANDALEAAGRSPIDWRL
jgi:uracil-DNA glycosylase